MPAAALPKRILGVTHIRLAALALFALGAGLGFLGILALRQTLASITLVGPEAAAAAGALCALLPGRRLSARAAPDKGTRAFLVLCGIGAAGGMVYLAALQHAWAKPASLALLGLACGGCLRLSVALVLAMLPPWRPAAIMGVCGASLGLGGVAANLVGAWSANAAARLDPVLLAAAAVPLLLVLASIRSGRVRFEAAAERWGSGHADGGTGPRGILIAASLLLQATACGLAVAWLTSYLSRRVGFSLVEGAVVMALFWSGVAFGWAAAERLPRLRDNLYPLVAPLALVVAGAASLLFARVAVLAVAGAPLLGLATGLLLSLTLRLGDWPATLGRSLWVMRSLHVSLVVSLAGSWAVAVLVSFVGFGTPVWAIAGCMLAAVGALFLLVVDCRISGDAVMI